MGIGVGCYANCCMGGVCMSHAFPNATTFFYRPFQRSGFSMPSYPAIGSCLGTPGDPSPCEVIPAFNTIFFAEDFDFGTFRNCNTGVCFYYPGDIIACSGPPLQDDGYTFFKSMGNNPDFWLPPPENWPEYPDIPASWWSESVEAWGGWTWCYGRADPIGGTVFGSPPRFQKPWENQDFVGSPYWESCKDWWPYSGFPLSEYDAGQRCGFGAGFNQSAMYTLNLTANPQKHFEYFGFGKAADPITGELFDGNWFDFLTIRASQNFQAWDAPRRREGPFTFKGRSYMWIAGGGTAWKYTLRKIFPNLNLGNTYQLEFETRPFDILTQSASFVMKRGGTVEEAVKDGISMNYTETFPMSQNRTANVRYDNAWPGLSGNGGYSSWFNIDEWLRGMLPSDGIFFGFKLDPGDFVEPPIIESVSEKGIGVHAGPCFSNLQPGILPVDGYHRDQKHWKYTYRIEVRGHIEIEVTDTSNGQKGTMTLGGSGSWT